MEQIPFEQLGTAGMTIVALVWVVKSFLKSNEKIAGDFKNTIDNHLQHDTEAKIELKEAVNKNTEIIAKLWEKL